MAAAPRARRPANRPFGRDTAGWRAIEGVVMVADGRTFYEPSAPLSADVRPPLAPPPPQSLASPRPRPRSSVPLPEDFSGYCFPAAALSRRDSHIATGVPYALKPL